MFCTNCGRELSNDSRFCSQCGQGTRIGVSPSGGDGYYAPRRLYRLTYDKHIGGVCAGLAKYLDVDVTLVRVITLAVAVLTGILPGILVYLLREKGLDADQIDYALNYASGLLGVSGMSSDMRQVLAAVPHNPDARLAVDVYVHRIRHTVGAMAATLGGVDALVFTAGVGEHAAAIRAQVCENLGYLGLSLDRTANDGCQPDADVALPASTGRVLVIATREDVTIVREIRQLLSHS